VNDERGDVRQLLEGVAPERGLEIEALFSRVGIDYHRANDRPGFYLETLDRVVLYNDRTLQQIYLIAFLTWKALTEQSGAIIVSLVRGQPYDETKVRRDPEQQMYERRVDELALALQKLRTADELHLAEWPVEVPRLGTAVPSFSSVTDRAAYETALFALAYVLLHETRHAMFAVDGDAPGGLAEEVACDAYATEFLMKGIHEYAAMSRFPAHKVATKRAIGLLIGQAIIVESTPEHRWNVADNHPPVGERLRTTLEALGLPPLDHAWVFASSMLLAKLRRVNRPVGVIDFATPLELYSKLVKLL
jgi:hypothetical protein